jgi:lauroyl/myristoyl acyltransferase
MELLAASIERQVMAHPEQWLCFHRVWCEDQLPVPLPAGQTRAS